MRFVSSVVAILLLANALSAQPLPVSAQQAERARQLLNSVQWVDKAWGAYLAGRLHSPDLDQALIEQFRFAMALRDAPSHAEEHGFMAALFDAAIEAGMTVPAALLEPFEENWADAVLILLARDKDSEGSLLRLGLEKSRPIVWLAANNLLFERKSQIWYAATLAQISITHRFTVTDPGYGPGIGDGAGGGVSGGDGIAALPKGFPPVAFYTLQDGVMAQRGSVLLARGPQNVYYKRTVVPTDKQVPFGSGSVALDRMAIRIGYLAQLRHEPFEQTERLFHSETHIPFTTVGDFERQVEREMEAQAEGIRALIQDIVRAGLSAPDVRLRIVPEAVDRRQTATARLPAVPPREIPLQ
jgi:hypothetical protein